MLKVPLNVPDEALDSPLDAAETVVDLVHRSTKLWSEVLGMARRAVDVI